MTNITAPELVEEAAHLIRLHAPDFRVERATLYADMCEATDLVVGTDGLFRWGVRFRRHAYISLYPHDITFRAKSRYGGLTELDKTMSGVGMNRMLYGFTSESGDRVTGWRMVDVDNIRRVYQDSGQRLLDFFGPLITNHDGTGFVAVDTRAFPHATIAEDIPSGRLL